METVAKVASMSVARRQKLARLFGRLGLNAPLLEARYDHIGVEYLELPFGGNGWHGAPPSNQFRPAL
jgi:hypothetical protein